jgi:serine/threonine protein kinase
MPKLSRYTIRDTIHTTSQYLIQTASLPDNQNSFLIKSLTHLDNNNESLAQLQHEYYLLEKLSAVSGQFPKVSEVVEHGASYGIVLIDEGYQPLETILPQKQRSVENFFLIAIELTKAVATIHKTNIIHKHLIPQNIFYHPTNNTIQIYDFSIATELNRTMVPTDPPRLLQGTLEYMAPEQTGRMNRPLTQRADLYSLGIIFYEWLTGSVPFKAKEPMTIIFGHIATIPKSPHEIDKKVPSILSDIVMKLLSKPAEERYKSALGLLYDLEKAYAEFKKTNTITPFPLATKDIATQLELPEKLYGREEQVKALFHAFDTVNETQQNQLITVSGYSGIGKTSLVRELIPKIALAKGFFAIGKFDKFQQSDTYEGLRSALDKVVRYHLSLPEAEYQVFKHTLLSEMGGILPVVTEFIPRLTTIVGAQEEPYKLGIEATRNRFELAIRRFIKITSLHHPFVLFLDDMQWANQSMFSLLQKIITSDDIQNLLLILSYRSNEVDEHHPLLSFLTQVEKKHPVTNIKITGLTEDALNQLLQDML